jgi:hypothetical protein
LKSTDEQYKTKFKAIQTNTSLSEDDKKSQMKALRTSQDADIQKILTPDQYTKLKADREKKGRP